MFSMYCGDFVTEKAVLIRVIRPGRFHWKEALNRIIMLLWHSWCYIYDWISIMTSLHNRRKRRKRSRSLFSFFSFFLFCCCLWILWKRKERETVSQPLPVFLQDRHFLFLAQSLIVTSNKFFDWLIIPSPLPIPFTLFSLDRKRRKRTRKKKKLIWYFWLQFLRASDSASDSSFWFTLDRNAPCAYDSESAFDSATYSTMLEKGSLLYFKCQATNSDLKAPKSLPKNSSKRWKKW